jgi:hypothetical protein
MGTAAEEQAANVQPPRRGAVLAISVDTTARPYDLSSLDLGGITPEADHKRRHETWVTLQADGGDVYYYFSSATASNLDNTAAVAAGGTPAYATTHGAKIKQDDRHEVRIDRSRDVFLIVKTSTGTATLRFWASSHAGS